MTKEWINQRIKEAHKNAVKKGFYDCPECGGSGLLEDPEAQCSEYPGECVYDCPACNGTGIDPNKNIGELLMLIVSELGEALEAHRKGWFHFNETIPSNLEYTDHSGNNIHAIKTGLTSRKRSWLSFLGKRSGKKLSLDDQFDVAFRFKSGETARSIHSDYQNVSLSAIKKIRQKGIEKYTDCMEMEIADVYIRLFDLCGYLGIDVNSFYHITGWENSFKSSNIAVSFLVITRKICEFHESYIYTIFTELMGLVNELNIPIEKHIEAKMAYNKTRQTKHGKAY
jgi:hypothetical protein